MATRIMGTTLSGEYDDSGESITTERTSQISENVTGSRNTEPSWTSTTEQTASGNLAAAREDNSTSTGETTTANTLNMTTTTTASTVNIATTTTASTVNIATTTTASTVNIVTTTTASTVNIATATSGLFDYGDQEGDKAFDGDDNLKRQHAGQGFPIGSTREKSLYMSTNGYIVFGRKYNKFSPRKFPLSNLKIVAPYWTDSTTYSKDTNSTGSKVFYQVYAGRKRHAGTTKVVFDRVNLLVSSKRNVRRFKARWILKVTWHNMFLSGRNETSTYQCILATDYQRSFAMFLYEDGGLKWQGNSHNYAPGIGYQVERRKYYNSPYSRRLEAFRMDSIKGNTGKPGLWIFLLANNLTGISPALKCFLWYESQSASDVAYMRKLDSRLSDCPCTMWQANFDSRFRRAKREKGDYKRSRCFYTRLSPRGMTGARKCCYRATGWFWWGWGSGSSSLDTDVVTGGGLNRYNPSSAKQKKRYNKHDRSPFLNCCVRSGLCPLYREFRRLNNCKRYRPPRRARFWGDPHITTLDGKGYTFNGWGEYTLLEVKNSTTAESTWQLQGRTDRVRNAAGELTDATVFTAFAAKDYETNTTMQATLNWNKTDMNVFCNKVDYTLRFQNRSTDFNIDDDNLGCARPENQTLGVTFLSGISMNVSVGTELLDISVTVPEEMSSSVKTTGLLGVFNSNPDDDFTLPNGTSLSANSSEEQIFEFGQAWLISGEGSLFRYRWGDNASNHRHTDFTPMFLSDYPQIRVDEAVKVCGGSNECIYDYLSTNRSDIAQGTLDTAKATQEEASILSNSIPAVTLDRTTIEATVGLEARLHITASDADNESVTIYMLENITGSSNINQTGNNAIFTWTPVSLEPVKIGFGGTDPKGDEAPAQNIRLLLCNGCSNNGECNFNQSDVSVEEISSNGTTFTIVPCDCQDGWIGDACDLDYDGCADDPCPTDTNCTDLKPDQQQALNGVGFNCGDCPPGLRKSQSKCVDIDECNWPEAVCDQLCLNTDGSYNCACEDGYHLEGSSSCLDDDECQRGVHDCSHRCTNEPGSYHCRCEEGYLTFDEGRTCRIDPNNNPCDGTGLNCEYGCRKVSNGTECFCENGYTLTGTSCVDVDECETALCKQSCTNLDGSFRCNCFSGYKKLPDKITCEKCDPFHYGPNCDTPCGCSENAEECHHTRGCVCNHGWTGVDCETDVDECATVQCGLLQKCENFPSSYDCDCIDGYRIVSGQCTDIDECADESTHNCTYECVNVQGSFLCQCSTGYTGDGFACNDVDECNNQVANCQQKCVNTEGGFMCDCYPGFDLNDDRVSCTDVDVLCGKNAGDCNHICSVNETTSANQCFCYQGFQLANSTFCQDIDECHSNICSQTCDNTIGNFRCTCTIGYIIGNDGITCEECDVFHWGDYCQNECNCGPGSTCDNTIGCACAPGWTGHRCDSDIQECQDPTTCDEGSVCVETLDSYRCDCPAGTQRVNGACTDIDECATNTHDCSQICVNTDRAYTCLCHPGYRSQQSDDKACDDIDECLDGHLCEALCSNTEGGFTCGCHKGFNLKRDQLTCSRTSNALCGTEQLACSYGCNNNTGECFCANENELQTDGFSCRLIRYRVKAKVSLQLTFTGDVTKTHTDAYKTMVHNIEEALMTLYQDIPNFKTVLVTQLELIDGGVSAVHEVLFRDTVSLEETQSVTAALLTAHSNGTGLTVGGVDVPITTVPVLFTAGNKEFLVNTSITCAMEPCAYDEVCIEITGVTGCYPEGTKFADPEYHNSQIMAIGLGGGVSGILILVLIIVIYIAVKPPKRVMPPAETASGSMTRVDHNFHQLEEMKTANEHAH